MNKEEMKYQGVMASALVGFGMALIYGAVTLIQVFAGKDWGINAVACTLFFSLGISALGLFKVLVSFPQSFRRVASLSALFIVFCTGLALVITKGLGVL